MEVKRNIIAVLLIGLIIALTPYYMSLFSPDVENTQTPFSGGSAKKNNKDIDDGGGFAFFVVDTFT